MADIKIVKKNEAMIRIECDAGISRELAEQFTFDVPGAKFTPTYKSGRWDGKIRLYNYMARETYHGLADDIEKFAQRFDYTIENTLEPDGKDVTREGVKVFMDSLKFVLPEGSSINPYQYESVYQMLKNDRLLLVSPTSSGKSMMIASLVRWHQQQDRRTLVITPTISLVDQMFGDFDEYFSKNGWKSKDHCYKIKAGVEKNTKYDVVISTWQSLQNVDKDYFNQFDCIIVDEAHTAKAKTITGIMCAATNVRYRYGCTGSLDKTETNELVLRGLFGKIFRSITTQQLIKNKQISGLNIKCMFMQYSDEDKKKVTAGDYKQEIDFLVGNVRRNKFLSKLALSCEKNTLVLFNFRSHGQAIFDLINSRITDDRKVFFIHGGVDGDTREEIRKIVESEKNAIIVASFGVYSTGVNIRNLHNIIFASPSKSVIRILQSIGRGLRKAENKTHCNLFDIGDDLSWKTKKNYTLLHAIERIKIYASEGFDYKLMKIDLR